MKQYHYHRPDGSTFKSDQFDKVADKVWSDYPKTTTSYDHVSYDITAIRDSWGGLLGVIYYR